MTIVLFNKQHQTITKQKTCYNWEYARGKILADNYVSIFNSRDFFVQINCSKWNLLLALFLNKRGSRGVFANVPNNYEEDFFAKTVNG